LFDEPGVRVMDAGLVSRTGELTRLRLDIAYEGTEFSGWASQPGRRTVQGDIEVALATALRMTAPPQLTVAGRTDAGVHARGQVAHVDVAALPEHGERRLVRSLNGILAADVRVNDVRLAARGFDARFSALSRRYSYRVADGLLDPLRRRDTLAWPRPLDVEAMNAAATRLLGEHDFAAFCKRREGATTVRGLLGFDWRRDENDVVVARVEADAFCHSMVRALVGALLAVGEGRRDVGWPSSMLESRVRDSAVNVAPAHGLTLEEVKYPDDEELAARASATRRRRDGVGRGRSDGDAFSS
jgi:tRNA pseudouridine38-40 synthase